MTTQYVRSFKRLSRSLQDRLIIQERLFRANALDPRLRTHKLKGHLRLLWAYSVDYSHRILFEFKGPDTVLYHDVGSHEVYR